MNKGKLKANVLWTTKDKKAQAKKQIMEIRSDGLVAFFFLFFFFSVTMRKVCILKLHQLFILFRFVFLIRKFFFFFLKRIRK